MTSPGGPACSTVLLQPVSATAAKRQVRQAGTRENCVPRTDVAPLGAFRIRLSFIPNLLSASTSHPCPAMRFAAHHADESGRHRQVRGLVRAAPLKGRTGTPPDC